MKEHMARDCLGCFKICQRAVDEDEVQIRVHQGRVERNVRNSRRKSLLRHPHVKITGWRLAS